MCKKLLSMKYLFASIKHQLIQNRIGLIKIRFFLNLKIGLKRFQVLNLIAYLFDSIQ